VKKHDVAKRKRLRRKRMVKALNRFMTRCAVVILILCVGYVGRDILVHLRSNQIASETRKYQQETVSTQNEDENLTAASPAEAVEATIEATNEAMMEAEIDATTATMVLENVAYAESVAPASQASPEPPVEEPAQAGQEPAEAAEESAEAREEPGEAKEEPVVQERFVELYERNHDLVGWIYANEAINYPIVWLDDDNDFYMNHDYDKNKSDEGWIFLDKRNGSFMDDDQLLIYGHNMRVGTMFGELDQYRTMDYVRKHPIIEVQSIYEEEPRKYVIISMFDASMNKDHESYIKITQFNFETPEEKQAYIEEICARSMRDLPCSATSDDQLIMLVTCSYSQPNGRFLVVARELREDETEEQITAIYASGN